MEDILKEVAKMGDILEKAKQNAEKAGSDSATALSKLEAIEKKFADAEIKSADDLAAFKKEFQSQIDEIATRRKVGEVEKSKTFDEVLIEKFEPVLGDIQKELKSAKGKFRLDLPDVKSMTLSSNLSGDPQATYGPRQAIYPAQQVNMRDLIPTMQTDTGLYVFYQENQTGFTNNVGKQTEGSVKGENSYALSEIKVVQSFIAGFSRFSKQMANSLPFLTQVLPRMLQRDFFKKENALFYATAVAAATGTNTTSETDSVKKLIDLIGNQRTANFNASAVIVSHAYRAALVKSTYTNGYYPGAGNVIFDGQTLYIDGTPIISASWATSGHFFVFDADYLERVQVSGLAIELSYEDSDNFQRNLVTARIECQEEINPMLGASMIYL